MKDAFLASGITALALGLCLTATDAVGQAAGTVSAGSVPDNSAMHSATPRTADGKPDLSGLWVPANNASPLIIRKDEEGRTTKLLFPAPDADEAKGDALNRARRAAAPNQPPYKPELLEKVKYLDEHANEFDGVIHCQPAGVPRMGPPQQIVETPGQVVFLYDPAREVSVQSGNLYRIIPTDARPHQKDLEPSYLGESVGHWEGDALVVDVIGFNDLTWLTSDGRFHSEALHVIERFTRDGDTLRYEVTVEDPNVFTRPWIMNPRVLKLDPTALLSENPPCVERDTSHLVTNQHH